MTTAATPVTPGNTVPTVDPVTAKRWLEGGQAMLIDVREGFEHASAHIHGAKLEPLRALKAEQVARPGSGQKTIVYCKGGVRSQQAAAMLLAAGWWEVYSMSGGIEAWKAAGLPIVGSGRRVIDAQRQVFMIVGCMVLAGVGLGVWVNAWWLVLAAAAGLGLLNAGLTGFCPMLVVVAKAPWNPPGSRAPAPGGDALSCGQGTCGCKDEASGCGCKG